MRSLHALILEESPEATELLVRALGRGGYEPRYETARTLQGLRDALRDESWDVVLAEHPMPGLSVEDAVLTIHAAGRDVPLIVVSRLPEEDAAVEVLRAGARDFIFQGRLARLAPSIEREIYDVVLRTERRKAEGALRDIEHVQQCLESHLVISDRMAAIGMLAAGVAHEVNNPMTAVIANLDLAIGEAERPAPTSEAVRRLRDELHDARQAAERVLCAVHDLETFARPEDGNQAPVDVRQVLDSAIRIAWTEIRHRARLVKGYRDVPLVDANDSQLGQVFLNLLINAAQAIPEGAADVNEIRVSCRLTEDGQVGVDIRDSGVGIGTGTGLGLSICHRIVHAIGGTLRVETEVGKGTAFQVCLPAAKVVKAAKAISAAPPRSGLVPRRRARVLIVDDDPAISRVVARTLEDDYDVAATASATDALDRIAAGQYYDVIVCDLMMPEMTGMDLHAQLEGVDPEQAERMVFMTGGAFTPRAREFLDACANPRLQKPFRADELREIVARQVA